MTGQIIENTAFTQSSEFDDALDKDFSELWEDQMSDEPEDNKDDVEEEPMKFHSSLSSFQDFDPDTMFECFDIEEMADMIESQEKSENKMKQDAIRKNRRANEVISSRFEESSSYDSEDCPKTSLHRPACRKPNRSLSPPRKRHASEEKLFNMSKSDSRLTQDMASQNSNCFDENQYQTLLCNLAASMRRTEMTRAQVVQIQQNFRRSTNNSQNGNNSSLSAFFSGSRSTLTNGLEQSRQQLQGYMAQMRQCNSFF